MKAHKPCLAIMAFQFHKGTIKTLLTQITMSKNGNFNSIKVRLKHEYSTPHITYIHLFQFHKGTIKTQTPVIVRTKCGISIP